MKDKSVVIIDYGAGNIQSLKFSLSRMGYKGVLSKKPEEIQSASKVIFPGVGHARSAMEKLKDSGLVELIPRLEQPVLGICLGMQLMCNFSEEGSTPGLGIFEAVVRRFPKDLKVPQMGWNTLEQLRSPLFTGLPEGTYAYMVHSYFVPLCDHTIAITPYGVPYSAAMQRANFFGVQFHPEKSSSAGERLLSNFLNLPSEQIDGSKTIQNQ